MMNGLNDAISSLNLKKVNEKSFIDKALSKDDIEKIRVLMKKSPLTREDLLDLLYLVSSAESKLYNFDERERYVMLKMFVWLREFVKILELLYDVKAHDTIILTDQSEKMINDIRSNMEHSVKFLIDLYLNISRTSLSKGGKAFNQFLDNKFEFMYNNNQVITENNNKPSLLGSIRGK